MDKLNRVSWKFFIASIIKFLIKKPKIEEEEFLANVTINIHGIITELKMTHWISVKDRLPEDYHFVLCFNSKENRILLMFLFEFKGNKHWGRHGGTGWNERTSKTITHWMPLPEPPEGE